MGMVLLKVSGIPGTSLLETTEAIFHGGSSVHCPQMIGASLTLFTRWPEPNLTASSFFLLSSSAKEMLPHSAPRACQSPPDPYLASACWGSGAKRLQEEGQLAQSNSGDYG